MSSIWSQLFPGRRAPEPTPRDLVLAQRERLLGCALQVLQDGPAAQEVVLKALGQALSSPMLVPLASGGEATLARWLDRLVVNLSLTRLRQAAPVRPGARGADALESGEPRSLMEALRRPVIPTTAPPMRPPPPPPARTQAPAEPESAPGRQAGARSGAPGPGAAPGRQVPPEIQQLERLAQALRVLSPEARVVVTLVLMQGRPLAEVAELLGCSEEGCRFWLQHGRKLLRRTLQRDLLEAEPELPSPSALSPTGVLHDLRRGKKAAARA